jgi:aspartyl-tRNA(Asn)/glutamyl-tRNA(Gln) amidotransferase subunit B
VSSTPSILDHYPDYEVVIGIEVHAQLTTNTKIFCSCANEITKEPNTNICQICAGHPGVLPVLNKQVLEYAVKAGLATNCTINLHNEFDRKHYFYPDLPKGYQITQNAHPICVEGYVPIQLEDKSIKKIRLVRIHMEEDAGKNIHAGSTAQSFVDLNRAGTPLLEIVSYPDIATTYEAKTYLKTLHDMVTYLGICTGNMEEGAFRADTNISVRKKGVKQLGTKCELKNINSFKFISDAIEYEIERQIKLVESGQRVRQETRLWDTKEKKTFVMRSKEEAADYRYIPDPDLPIISLDQQWIKSIKETMPELPDARLTRYTTHHGLSHYEAEILIGDRPLAAYYEKAHALNKSKQIINWILRDLMSYLNDNKITAEQTLITPEKLSLIIELLESGNINNHAAKELFLAVAQTGKDPREVVKERGLEQIGSVQELEKIISRLVTAHPNEVAQYRSGKDRVFSFFVGLAMKQTQGKGNPKIIQELLKKYLS